MRYASICSGIEAASVAWHPLGWSPVFFAENDKFPSAVLKHRHPDVPNYGDITKFKDWPDAAFDVLVGGTPCQSFSVAGLRKGLADPRGNLALTYLAIADRYEPTWVLWENVPGVLSSDGGWDFGAFLGGLAELGYGWAYRVLDAQYVRVDGLGRAVPQRRRRVFVVGHLGDWRRAAAVLFERESLFWDSAPRRETGKGTSADIAPGLTASGRSVERTGESRGQDPLIAVADVCGALNNSGGNAYPGQTLQDATVGQLIAFGGNNTSGPIEIAAGLNAKSTQRGDFDTETFIAFSCKDHDADNEWAVRRLTPLECERLQGFPDNYTAIPYRGKIAADGPRYKALGNSFAVNVVRWIGTRIAMVASAMKEAA